MVQTIDQQDELEQAFSREPIAKPLLGALLFHVLIFGGAAAFAFLEGLFPHNNWGGPTDGGAISVQVVSNALPLPADQKPNDNVLATETPSEAPAPPAPKAEPTVDEKAIPIPSKIEPAKKVAEKKQDLSKIKPPVITPPIASKPNLHPQPTPKLDNRAQFGEQSAGQIPRSAQPTNSTTIGSVTVSSSGARGFNYPYYVQSIERKMQQNLFRGEVDPATPHGSEVNILFTIRRDGSVSDIKLDKSSGSPTFDRACLRSAQRVDTFGPLPSPPSDGNLMVSHHCDF